jgi:hypothetical protein
MTSIAAECEFRVQVHEEGYIAREIVPGGERLYDPALGFVDDDGSVVLCDIGGQPERGWDPDSAHGSLLRLHPDGTLETIVPTQNLRGMPMTPKRAPASFGDWGGHIFYAGQGEPGRKGALSPHLLYRVPPGSDTPVTFAEMPHAGAVGGGTAGALVIGPFGPDGSEHEGRIYLHSQMNCTVYQVTPDGIASPYLILDESSLGRQIMPVRVFIGGPLWPEAEGKLVVGGRLGLSFEERAPGDNTVDFWVVEDGKLADAPVASGDAGLALAATAPASFGRFAGDVFTINQGSVNLNHVTKPPPGPLPYDAAIVRTDSDGRDHVFADDIQTGWNTMLFDADRLVVSQVRRSYSTGEYHEPDGSIFEIVAVDS